MFGARRCHALIPSLQGVALHQAYEAKCNRLKDIGSQCVRLKAMVREKVRYSGASRAHSPLTCCPKEELVEKLQLSSAVRQEQLDKANSEFTDLFKSYKELSAQHTAMLLEHSSLENEVRSYVCLQSRLKFPSQLEEARNAIEAHKNLVAEHEQLMREHEDLLQKLSTTNELLELNREREQTPEFNEGEIFALTQEQASLVAAAVLAYSPDKFSGEDIECF